MIPNQINLTYVNHINLFPIFNRVLNSIDSCSFCDPVNSRDVNCRLWLSTILKYYQFLDICIIFALRLLTLFEILKVNKWKKIFCKSLSWLDFVFCILESANNCRYISSLIIEEFSSKIKQIQFWYFWEKP